MNRATKLLELNFFQISRISHYESEIQNLRDELDICREKVENVKNLETKLNQANIKLTQMQNLKQRVKVRKHSFKVEDIFLSSLFLFLFLFLFLSFSLSLSLSLSRKLMTVFIP
jgi:hypothetical protein